MSCGSRYSTAENYASFWCIGQKLMGADDGGGVGFDHLTDSQADFVNDGVKASVGMILYNVTDHSSGPVTAVDAHTIHATLTGGTGNHWDDGDRYLIVTITGAERTTIENYLDIAAADIWAALAAVDACSCTVASWMTGYLEKLNVVDALIFHRCPCGRPQMELDERKMFFDWVNNQLELLRTNKIDVCSGATPADWPAVSFIEGSYTDFNAAVIYMNRYWRGW
jgi:hypothetical protein